MLCNLFSIKIFGTFCFVFISGLSVAQNQSDIVKVTFQTATRGYQASVTFTSDSIVTSEASSTLHPTVKSLANTSKQWSSMLNALDNLEVTNIGSLQSPSKKRVVDAAHHSSIIVTTAAGNSYQHNFDNEEPHLKLKPLMKQISLYRTRSVQ